MITNIRPEMDDINDTPFDRYVVAITDGINLTAYSSYFYFVEDSCEEYEALAEQFGEECVVMILNEPGQMFVRSVDQTLSDRKNYGVLPLPADRKWDLRDGCFPAVLFPEKGA